MNRKPELTKEESEGFDRFVREHYVKMLKEASKAEMELGNVNTPGIFAHAEILAIFDKMATPRVFLIDAWRKLSSEEHMVYSYPDPVEREKARAKAEEISKQAREMIQA